MHPLFWDPELSRMHLHPQIQIPNAFPAFIVPGQRDKSPFIVPGQRDNGTGSESCRGTGQARILRSCHGTGWDGILAAFPTPEYPGIGLQVQHSPLTMGDSLYIIVDLSTY